MESQLPTTLGPDSRPSAASSIPDVAGYEILAEIARGGMGVVYQARQRGLDRLVALKMILSGPHASDSDLIRFRTEAETISRLQHPNLVTVYDVGESKGLPFLAMEFVEGGSLDAYLRRNGALGITEAAELIETLARALHAVHQRGVLHRDMKPGNILLLSPHGKLAPKITDFGLAKHLERSEGLTAAGTILGTPGYMAPEQASGRADVGPSADIHALGAILYTCLVLRPPYEGETTWLILERTLHQEPLPLRRQRRDIPRDLETICLKCLRKDPSQRYQDARALADDVERFRDHLPIEGRPTPAWERLLLWSRRRPALAGMLILGIASMLVVLVGGQIYQRRLTTALAEARNASEESRRQLVQLSILQGSQALDEDNFLSALDWFVHGLRLDQYSGEAQRGHRIRIGTVLRSTPRLHQMWFMQGPIRIATFDLAGNRVLIGGEDGRARIWDSRSGHPVGPEWYRPSPVMAGAFVGDLRVFLGRRDGTVTFHDARQAVMWDLAIQGRPAHDGPITSLTASRDGTRLLTTGIDGKACLWSVEAPGPPLATCQQGSSIVAADITIGGERIVTGALDGTAQVWSGLDGKPIGRALVHHAAVLDVRFSPGGENLATACADGAVRVYDRQGNRQFESWHRDKVVQVRYSPDGAYLVSSSDDTTAQVWDPRTGNRTGPPLQHESGVNGASFSPNGRRVLTASDDNTAQVWTTKTGEADGPRYRHNGTVQTASFSPDGKRVMTAGHDGLARLWDAEVVRPPLSAVVEPVLNKEKHAPGRWLSPKGDWVLVAQDDHGAQVFDTTTNEPISPPLPHASSVQYAAFLWDGRRVMTGSDDNLLRIWDVKTGTLVGRPLAHRGTVRLGVFSDDGSMCFTYSGNHQGRVWEIETGTPLTPRWRLPGLPRSAVFDPEGSKVSVYQRDGEVRTWDLRPVEETIECLERLSMLLSGRQVVPHRGLMPLTPAELQALWQQ